jgi:hypothetical protein
MVDLINSYKAKSFHGIRIMKNLWEEVIPLADI